MRHQYLLPEELDPVRLAAHDLIPSGLRDLPAEWRTYFRRTEHYYRMRFRVWMRHLRRFQARLTVALWFNVISALLLMFTWLALLFWR